MDQIAVTPKVWNFSKIETAIVKRPCFFAYHCTPIPLDRIEWPITGPIEPRRLGLTHSASVIIFPPSRVSARGKEEGEQPPAPFAEIAAAIFCGCGRCFFHGALMPRVAVCGKRG